MADDKNGVSIDYLIEILASTKSALSNLDNHSSQIYNILSELSENFQVLTEIYKKQNQDQKMNLLKFDNMVRDVHELTKKVELSNQEILASNEKLNSNANLLSEFKKDSIDNMEQILKNIEQEIKYLKEKEQEREIAVHMELKKHEEEKSEKSEKKRKNLLFKILDFVKNVSDSIHMLYKIIIISFIILLIILFLFGIISFSDIRHILGFKVLAS